MNWSTVIVGSFIGFILAEIAAHAFRWYIEPAPRVRFFTNGKEILDGGKHYADAVSEEAAIRIATALNARGKP